MPGREKKLCGFARFLEVSRMKIDKPVSVCPLHVLLIPIKDSGDGGLSNAYSGRDGRLAEASVDEFFN